MVWHTQPARRAQIVGAAIEVIAELSDEHARGSGPSAWGAARVARWAGLAGFALPALTLVAYPIWSFPGTQTPGAEVARWAATNHDRLMVTMMLNTVGVTLWYVFGAGVYVLLRDRMPARTMLPTCFAGSFFGCVTLLLSGFTAFDLLLYRQHGADTSILLYDITFGLLAMSGMPTVVALASFAAAVYVHHALPRYTAHLAVAAALIHPLLLVTFVVRDGPLSLEGIAITAMPAFLFAWILGTALAMPHSSHDASVRDRAGMP